MTRQHTPLSQRFAVASPGQHAYGKKQQRSRTPSLALEMSRAPPTNLPILASVALRYVTTHICEQMRPRRGQPRSTSHHFILAWAHEE